MDNYQNNIEKYIAGKMTADEQKDFEQQLVTNSALSKAYKSELTARQLIIEAGRLELKNTLDNFDAEMNRTYSNASKTRRKVMPLWAKRLLPIAAMLIIFIGVYQTIFNNVMTSSEAYHNYFETYAAPSVVRNANGNEFPNWEIATNLYTLKEYKEALFYFSKAEGEIPQYLLEFYKGMSTMNMETPYYQNAINSFETVLETDNDFREQANWYKGLALLQLNKKVAALIVFESIAEIKSFNYKKAEEILKLKLKD